MGNEPGPDAILLIEGRDPGGGASCYNSLDCAKVAQDNDADYVAFGAVYPYPDQAD